MVFFIVTTVGIFVMRDLHTTNVEAQKMYAGSVLGLRRIGELQYEAQETRRATFYALTTDDSNLQIEYADQSREADRLVNEGIIEYLRQARTPQEIEIAGRLQGDWSEYLKVRNEVLASILEGSTKEAVDLDLAGACSRSIVSVRTWKKSSGSTMSRLRNAWPTWSLPLAASRLG